MFGISYDASVLLAGYWISVVISWLKSIPLIELYSVFSLLTSNDWSERQFPNADVPIDSTEPGMETDVSEEQP